MAVFLALAFFSINAFAYLPAPDEMPLRECQARCLTAATQQKCLQIDCEEDQEPDCAWTGGQCRISPQKKEYLTAKISEWHQKRQVGTLFVVSVISAPFIAVAAFLLYKGRKAAKKQKWYYLFAVLLLLFALFVFSLPWLLMF